MQRHGCLQAMAWAAFNGVGLAFVLPCAQSILADYYIPEQRGRAFGFMFTLAALGEPLGCRWSATVLGAMAVCRQLLFAIVNLQERHCPKECLRGDA